MREPSPHNSQQIACCYMYQRFVFERPTQISVSISSSIIIEAKKAHKAEKYHHTVPS